MAKIEENFSMQGMSGKVANKRFKAASIYAKNALLDPTLKELYTAEAKKRDVASPYNMAMADYLRPPVIDKINAEAYTGSASGEKIIIEADDKFKVISLKVKITKSNGSLIEEGQASLSEGKWVYTTTAANASPTGDKITVIATDRTGNSTTKEITL